MTNTENINVAHAKEAVNTVVEAVEAIPVKAKGKGGVIAAVVFGGAALVTVIALGIRNHKTKEAKKEPAAADVDNVRVAKNDFEEVDFAEN